MAQSKSELSSNMQQKTVLVQIIVDGIVMGTIPAKFREFSTGSIGFNVNGKAATPDGAQLQVSGNLTVCGSKNLS